MINLKSNNLGLGIIEALVGISLFVISSYFVITMLIQNYQQISHLDGVMEFNQMINRVESLLNDPKACKNAFRDATANPLNNLATSNQPINKIFHTDSSNNSSEILSVPNSIIESINSFALSIPSQVDSVEGKKVNRTFVQLEIKSKFLGKSNTTNLGNPYRTKIFSYFLHTDIASGGVESCYLAEQFNTQNICEEIGGKFDSATQKCNPLGVQSSLYGSCPSNKYSEGVDSAGNFICKNMPSAPPPKILNFSWTSSSSTPTCPANAVMSSFLCPGKCGSAVMQIGCLELEPAQFTGSASAIASASQSSCPAGSAISGFDCTGSCGKSQMQAKCLPMANLDSTNFYWTSDNETGGCSGNYVACGFDCTGSCGTENMIIKCCKLTL